MGNEEMVTITKKRHEYLKERDELLDWLENIGVDNWSNYSTPPDRKDYATDKEYDEAYDKALDGG